MPPSISSGSTRTKPSSRSSRSPGRGCSGGSAARRASGPGSARPAPPEDRAPGSGPPPESGARRRRRRARPPVTGAGPPSRPASGRSRGRRADELPAGGQRIGASRGADGLRTERAAGGRRTSPRCPRPEPWPGPGDGAVATRGNGRGRSDVAIGARPALPKGEHMSDDDVTVEQQADLMEEFLVGLLDAFGVTGRSKQSVDEDTIEVKVPATTSAC